jgi:hypothetical protein
MTTPPAVSAPQQPTLPPVRRPPLRLYLTGRALVVLATCMVGVALFSVWVTAVAISPITFVAALVLPATALVRGYANAHRRVVHRLLGRTLLPGYRQPAKPGLISRIWTIERDPASWRDALWCLFHGVVACLTSALTVALFGGGLFYLLYPFLYWVTPQRVFGRPFGDLIEFHSVAQAAVMTPIAVVCFGFWYALVLPLARAELALTCRLLGRAESLG